MTKYRLIYLFLATFLICGLSFSPTLAQRPEPVETEVKGHTMYTLMPPGGIPAIFDPVYTGVEEAGASYYPNEPLMVVTHNGETKGWSTWHLDHHEVVNDVIGGTAIAATW